MRIVRVLSIASLLAVATLFSTPLASAQHTSLNRKVDPNRRPVRVLQRCWGHWYSDGYNAANPLNDPCYYQTWSDHNTPRFVAPHSTDADISSFELSDAQIPTGKRMVMPLRQHALAKKRIRSTRLEPAEAVLLRRQMEQQIALNDNVEGPIFRSVLVMPVPTQLK